MSNELCIVDESVISYEIKTEINEDIDRIISAHKNNRQAINKLVFESVAAMTEADDAQAELSNKGWFKRRLGSITGSNSRLQDKINSNRATAMYASQQTLQKLAEQNLMTFDLIAAVNNKLNASLIKVDEEFANIYQGLAKFFKTNRSELARLEARLEKMERNISLLNWQNSIEYQEFKGIEYIDLDDVSKIACLVRDFYDITKGEWTNSDLLLLKSAMRDIGIQPKANVNYFEVLKGISYNNDLKEYMLGGRTIEKIDDPSYLLSLGCLKKHEMLNDEESYIVDTVVDQMNSMGVSVKRNVICDQMTAKYLATKAFVDVNVDVESYDLILDLLYNIRQAKDEELLISGEGVELDTGDLDGSDEGIEVDAGALFDKGLKYLEGDGVEQSDVEAYNFFKQAAQLGDELAIGMLGRCYDEGIGVERDYSIAFECYQKAADLGNDVAMNDIGDLYYYGNGVTQDYSKALEWYRKAADLGNEDAIVNIERVTQELAKQRYGLIATIESSVVFDYSNRHIAHGMEKNYENVRVVISNPLRVAGKAIFKNCEIIFSWDGNIGFYLDEYDSEVIFQNCEFKTETMTKGYLFSSNGTLTFKNCLFDNVEYRSGMRYDTDVDVKNNCCQCCFVNVSMRYSAMPSYLVLDHCHIKNCNGTFIGADGRHSGDKFNIIVRDCLVENHTDNFLLTWYSDGSKDVGVKIINTNFDKGKDAISKLFNGSIPGESLIEMRSTKFDLFGSTFSNIEQNIFDFKDTYASDVDITDCYFTNCKQRERVSGMIGGCEFNGNKWYGDVVK